MPGPDDSIPLYEKVPFLEVPDSLTDLALKLIVSSKLGGDS